MLGDNGPFNFCYGNFVGEKFLAAWSFKVSIPFTPQLSSKVSID